MNTIPLKTAKAALSALEDAAMWIALGEEEALEHKQESWFTANPSFDRRRKALRAAIAKAEAAR